MNTVQLAGKAPGFCAQLKFPVHRRVGIGHETEFGRGDIGNAHFLAFGAYTILAFEQRCQ